jgi:hypothetical protein
MIKWEFARSYDLITAMLGTDYESSRQQGSRKGKPPLKRKRISTILGFIITLRKEVLEQREELQIIWEDIEKGVYKNVIPGSPAKKRKRDEQKEEPKPKDYFFTALSTDDEEEKEERILSKKSRRN